jgi:4-alpha-glucanotransferase
MLVQLEDLAGQIEQMNLPGTVDEHPNWRRKLRMDLDDIFDGLSKTWPRRSGTDDARRSGGTL